MAVPTNHDRGAFCDPAITLPQRHAIAPGKFDQLLQRAMAEPGIGGMRDRLWLHRRVDHYALKISRR
jgi:hypothetical protein